MNVDAMEEFRPLIGWFSITALGSFMAGFFGVGFLMYFGLPILIAMLIGILTEKDPKTRAILWGLIVGIGSGAFISAKYYLPHHGQ